jgi:hypothetical protein
MRLTVLKISGKPVTLVGDYEKAAWLRLCKNEQTSEI